MLDKVYVVLVESFTKEWEEFRGSFVAGVYINEDSANKEADRLNMFQEANYDAYVIPRKLAVKARSDANS